MPLEPLTDQELDSTWIDTVADFQGNMLSLQEQCAAYHAAAEVEDAAELLSFIGLAIESTKALELPVDLMGILAGLASGDLTPETLPPEVLELNERFHGLNAAVIGQADYEKNRPLEGQSSAQAVHAFRTLQRLVRRQKIAQEIIEREPIFQITPDPEVMKQDRDLLRRLPSNLHNVVLFGLTSCITTFERLIAELYRTDYRRHPALLGDQQISAGDVHRLGDSEKIHEYMVDIQIDKVMREGLKSWDQYLKSRFKMTMQLGGLWNRIVETNERRNILIHNDGRVSRQYLQIVPSSEREGVAFGDSPYTSINSILARISDFLHLGLYVAFNVWGKQHPGDPAARFGLYGFMANRALEEGRWADAAQLYELLRSDRAFRAPKEPVTITFLQWLLARKRLGGLDAIKDDLARFEHDGADPRNSAAAYALAEDLPQFLAVGGATCFGPQELADFEIFREFRELPEFRALYPELGEIEVLLGEPDTS